MSTPNDPLAEGMAFDDLFGTPDADAPSHEDAVAEPAGAEAPQPTVEHADAEVLVEEPVAHAESHDADEVVEQAEMVEPAPAAASGGFSAEEKDMFMQMISGMNRQIEVLSTSMVSLAERVEHAESREGRALPAASPAAELAAKAEQDEAEREAERVAEAQEAARAAADEAAAVERARLDAIAAAERAVAEAAQDERDAAEAAALEAADAAREAAQQVTDGAAVEAAAREAAERAAEIAAAEAAAREAAEAAAREAAAREAAAREASEREAAEAAAREVAEREAAEAAAREAAVREAAAREAAEREAAEAAAREVAAREVAAREAAEREAAEAAAREAAAAAGPAFEDIDTADGTFDEHPAEDFSDAFAELPGSGPKLSLPADSPFADDAPQDAAPVAVKRPSPQVAPAADINEYEPAYAGLDDDAVAHDPFDTALEPGHDSTLAPAPATQAPVGTGPVREPMDLLYAIAIVDPEAEASQREQQAAKSALTDAVAAEPKGKKQKVKLDPLPFDALVAGTPLIATYFSPSGGVGKSSQAMNTAVYIAAIADAMAKKRMRNGETNVRVPRILLLDGDVVQGSLALRLKGEVTPSMHTLMLYLDDRKEAGFQGPERWPAQYEDAAPGEQAMRDFVMWPEVLPNLNLLAAPDEPDLFFDFGPKEYREILQLLSRFYDVIIIDAGTEVVMESNRAWLGHANEVFMITAPEIDRIYNASKAARYIATSRPHPQDDSPEPRKLPPLVTADKLSVVMTRFDSDSGIDPERLMRESFPWLNDRPSQRFFIPDVSKEMTKANNTGRFLVLENAVYAKVIGKIAKHMFSRYAAQRQRSLPSGE